MAGDAVQSGDMNMTAFSENAGDAFRAQYLQSLQEAPQGGCANGGCATGDGDEAGGDEVEGGGGSCGGGGVGGGLFARFAQKILSGIMNIGRSLVG